MATSLEDFLARAFTFSSIVINIYMVYLSSVLCTNDNFQFYFRASVTSRAGELEQSQARSQIAQLAALADARTYYFWMTTKPLD